MAETETWFQKLFINEAKPALDRHSGGTEEITLQEKETNENGVVTPDEGYDGLGSVTVNVPDPPLQEKTATANGTVTPDAEYYGLSKVEVSIADAPVFQEKTVTSNGEVLPDEGYDGLSKVTVNLPEKTSYEGLFEEIILPTKYLEYTINSDNASYQLTGHTYLPARETNIIIADTYKGYPVTTMKNTIFSNNQNIESVRIGDNLTYISENAFNSCTSLTEVTFGENSNVKYINYYSFAKCVNLTSISLPATVTNMSSGAFRGCSSLRTITIKATVPPDFGTSTDAFYGTALEAIYVPADSVDAYKSKTYWRDFADKIQAIT